MRPARLHSPSALSAVLLLPLGVYLTNSGKPPARDQGTEEEAVVSAIEAVFAATERSDFDALDRLYADDDLTIIEGAGIDRGWTGYRDHHLKPELQQFRNFIYRPYDIEAHVHASLAWAIFRYEIKVEMKDRKIDDVGRGTAILEQRDGRWVVRHMQTASRPRRLLAIGLATAVPPSA